MDEYAKALDQVAAIAKDKQVDAVLIAGDVFDSPAPPPEAEKLVYNFLARLVGERIQCVLIAGNHDHPRKLDALQALLASLGIHVRHEVRPPDQGGVVTLHSKDGQDEARVAVLPFVAERKVVDACLVMDAEHKWYEEYGKRIEQILAALTKGLPATTVNIVLAHVLVDGARVGTGERELHLGQIYGINPQQLPSSVQYIGLGHLHRAQEVLAPAKTRYPGSLVELDFGEEQQDKSVVVFEAKPQKAPSVELVPITAGKRLRTITARLDELERYASEWTDDHLRVRVKADGPTPGLADRVKELLPNALDVSVDHPREPAKAGNGGAGRVKLAPSQLFAAYYEHRHQAPPPKELQQLFDQVHEEATK